MGGQASAEALALCEVQILQLSSWCGLISAVEQDDIPGGFDLARMQEVDFGTASLEVAAEDITMF